MATRTRRIWKPDPRGYYTRQIGWKLTSTGKLQQHKFILGTDLREAERRDRKLQELWEAFTQDQPEPRPLWSKPVLEVALEIAKGRTEIPVTKSSHEDARAYARRIELAQLKYPMVIFVSEDRRAFVSGQIVQAKINALPIPALDLSNFELPQAPSPELSAAAFMLKSDGYSIDPALELFVREEREEELPSMNTLLGVPKLGDPVEQRWHDSKASRSTDQGTASVITSNNVPGPVSTETTLHEAFAGYQQNLEKETYRPESGHVTPWGRTQIRQVHNLAQHHADCLLTELNADAVSELISYWRGRPCKIGSDVPMTAKTCSNYLGTLVRFLKWLDRSSRYQWKKPFAFNDLEMRVKTLASDHARKSLEQVDTFSLDELKLLMRYAHPFDRMLLLLSLNCGFGRAEISSLLVGEVYLLQGHSEREQELLGYRTSHQDSFIKRVRRKSGVYGEHILFTLTEEALQWSVKRRKSFPDFRREAGCPG